ncbi:lytic transglycosylase domain-containing protein [Pseudonocardia sp. T1-2H]|uniref:lytic transglycosylase domain-containing protein n=1 Tax=Pseudonocardia sp. T1-2H TaxID=3128899 RepID=UPI003101AA79
MTAVGIAPMVQDAYLAAERTLAGAVPGCKLTWSLLAGIGRIESGHAGGGEVDGAGRTLVPILGPQLSGSNGFATVSDTDGGSLDTDPAWDRAVGPMQFLPGTWRTYAADGNGDGTADPNNVFDAALTAGRFLCSGGRDLSTTDGVTAALLRYNASMEYVRDVLAAAAAYADGLVLPPAPVPAVSVSAAKVLAAEAPPVPAVPLPVAAPVSVAAPSTPVTGAAVPAPVPAAPVPAAPVPAAPVPAAPVPAAPVPATPVPAAPVLVETLPPSVPAEAPPAVTTPPAPTSAPPTSAPATSSTPLAASTSAPPVRRTTTVPSAPAAAVSPSSPAPDCSTAATTSAVATPASTEPSPPPVTQC